MERVGVRDEFGEVGSLSYLAQRFGLTAAHIINRVETVLERKGEFSHRGEA
jgi:transketolase